MALSAQLEEIVRPLPMHRGDIKVRPDRFAREVERINTDHAIDLGPDDDGRVATTLQPQPCEKLNRRGALTGAIEAVRGSLSWSLLRLELRQPLVIETHNYHCNGASYRGVRISNRSDVELAIAFAAYCLDGVPEVGLSILERTERGSVFGGKPVTESAILPRATIEAVVDTRSIGEYFDFSCSGDRTLGERLKQARRGRVEIAHTMSCRFALSPKDRAPDLRNCVDQRVA